MADDELVRGRCELLQVALCAPDQSSEPPPTCTPRNGIVRMKAGQHILRSGEIPQAVFTIQSGWAFRYLLLSDGRRQILGFLLPGDTACLESICLALHPLHFSVRALTDVTLCRFDAQVLARMVFESDQRRSLYCSTTRNYMKAMDECLADIGRRRASGRIAQFILRLERRLEERNMSNAGVFEWPIRREHLADALGLTTAHVNRTIAELERTGVLEIEQRQVRIVNHEALKKLADEE